MDSKAYKACVVPKCNNSTTKTQNKLFIPVPSKAEIRKKWLQLARRDPTQFSGRTKIYFCEDHFDLPTEMENFMKYNLFGSVSRIIMKPNCYPSKFDFQSDPKVETSSSGVQVNIKRKVQTHHVPILLKRRNKYSSLDTGNAVQSVSAASSSKPASTENKPMKHDKAVQVSPLFCDASTQTEWVEEYLTDSCREPDLHLCQSIPRRKGLKRKTTNSEIPSKSAKRTEINLQEVSKTTNLIKTHLSNTEKITKGTRKKNASQVATTSTEKQSSAYEFVNTTTVKENTKLQSNSFIPSIEMDEIKVEPEELIDYEEIKVEDVEVQEVKVEEVKVEDVNLEEVRVEELKVQEVKVEDNKVEEVKVEEFHVEEVKLEEFDVDEDDPEYVNPQQIYYNVVNISGELVLGEIKEEIKTE